MVKMDIYDEIGIYFYEIKEIVDFQIIKIENDRVNFINDNDLIIVIVRI